MSFRKFLLVNVVSLYGFSLMSAQTNFYLTLNQQFHKITVPHENDMVSEELYVVTRSGFADLTTGPGIKITRRVSEALQFSYQGDLSVRKREAHCSSDSQCGGFSGYAGGEKILSDFNNVLSLNFKASKKLYIGIGGFYRRSALKEKLINVLWWSGNSIGQTGFQGNISYDISNRWTCDFRFCKAIGQTVTVLTNNPNANFISSIDTLAFSVGYKLKRRKSKKKN